jgi:GNAT superfamily N-acetyltransferase
MRLCKKRLYQSSTGRNFLRLRVAQSQGITTIKIAIHDMTMADVADVIDLWGTETSGRRLPSRRMLTRFLDRGHGKIVRAQGRLIAATVFAICGPGTAYFEHFMVEAKSRRKHIGARLYKACTTELYDLGIRRVLFLVDRENEAAKAFWSTLSTSPIRRALPFYGKLARSE